jgi:hypothetical protein
MLSLAYKESNFSLLEATIMALRIKVSPVEFEAAESQGAVYGELRGKPGLSAYVELGREGEYVEKSGDNPQTRYRLFFNCNAYFAETEVDADDGNFKTEALDVTVIIYN